MKRQPDLLKEARGWANKAENDLRNASHCLLLEKDCPTDTVCFHAEQAIEKCLKALLIFSNIDFPRTHDVAHLISLLPSKMKPVLTEEDQEKLTDYATTTRYPGNYEEISLAEAQRVVRIAKQVKNKVTKILQK